MSHRESGMQVDAKGDFSPGSQRKTCISTVSSCLLAALALVCAGLTYRIASSRLDNLVGSPVSLPRPMKLVPMHMADWQGTDLSIPTTTKAYMERNFADDFMSRRYIKAGNEAWADLYVVYCSSRPGGIIGHKPTVCYPGHGWIHDGTLESSFTSAKGREMLCLIHEFHKPAPALDRTVVLNFYVVNGRVTTKEDDFSGAGWRRPNLAGDPAKYVAQIQISSTTENSVRLLARDASDHVLDFLPDADGNVAVVGANADVSTGDGQ